MYKYIYTLFFIATSYIPVEGLITDAESWERHLEQMSLFECEIQCTKLKHRCKSFMHDIYTLRCILSNSQEVGEPKIESIPKTELIQGYRFFAKKGKTFLISIQTQKH